MYHRDAEGEAGFDEEVAKGAQAEARATKRRTGETAKREVHDVCRSVTAGNSTAVITLLLLPILAIATLMS